MKIKGFIWMEHIVEKIGVKHDVIAEEVEEIWASKPKIRKMNKGNYRGEDVYRALGQTESGRYLAVFYIYKLSKKALILSARDMDNKERRSYGK